MQETLYSRYDFNTLDPPVDILFLLSNVFNYDKWRLEIFASVVATGVALLFVD